MTGLGSLKRNTRCTLCRMILDHNDRCVRELRGALKLEYYDNEKAITVKTRQSSGAVVGLLQYGWHYSVSR